MSYKYSGARLYSRRPTGDTGNWRLGRTDDEGAAGPHCLPGLRRSERCFFWQARCPQTPSSREASSLRLPAMTPAHRVRATFFTGIVSPIFLIARRRRVLLLNWRNDCCLIRKVSFSFPAISIRYGPIDSPIPRGLSNDQGWGARMSSFREAVDNILGNLLSAISRKCSTAFRRSSVWIWRARKTNS